MPRGLVEQVGYWPCQTTVTHIPRWGILSYLSADVHRTIHVRVHRRSARVTDVQSTLHPIRVPLPATTRTRLRRVSLARAVYENTVFLRLVFEQPGEAVELPAVEFLVATLTPIPRAAVLGLSNLAQVPDGNATNSVVGALIYDVFGECVQEVVFPSRQLLPCAERTLRRPVLAFRLVLVSREVVLVLFQHVPRIQLGVTVVVSDGEVVLDAEVDSRGAVAGGVLDGDFDLADEVELPAVAVPDGSHLLDVLHGHVWSCLVFYEDEV